MADKAEFAEYAEEIHGLNETILASQEERRFVFALHQAFWPSCHLEQEVALVDLSLVKGLGGLTISRHLRYPTTEQLTGRAYYFDNHGFISRIIAGVEEDKSLIGDLKRFRGFAPNKSDYEYVLAELRHGLTILS